MARPISEESQCLEPLSGDRSRRISLPNSTASLRRTVLSWCQRFGLLSVPREIRSLYHRIALQRKTGSVLMYQAVRQSLPHLDICDQPAEPPCSYGIRALTKER